MTTTSGVGMGNLLHMCSIPYDCTRAMRRARKVSASPSEMPLRMTAATWGVGALLLVPFPSKLATPRKSWREHAPAWRLLFPSRGELGEVRGEGDHGRANSVHACPVVVTAIRAKQKSLVTICLSLFSESIDYLNKSANSILISFVWLKIYS